MLEASGLHACAVGRKLHHVTPVQPYNPNSQFAVQSHAFSPTAFIGIELTPCKPNRDGQCG
jgi:hypothetical protein